MKRLIFPGFVVLTLLTGAGVALAQSSGTPAELPPPDFDGAQYVDSRGCVFSRVGVDEDLRWIPRVNAARQQICGRAPTFAAEPVAAPETPPVVAAGTEVEILVPSDDASVAPANAAAADTAATGTATAAPAAPVPATVPAAAPARPVPVAASAVAAPKPKRAAVGNRRSEPSLAGTVVTPATAAAKGVPETARVLPRHVYEERQEFRPVVVPKGFRKAWDDGRLNERRAEQTLQGHAAMTQKWHRGLPMREIER